MYIEDEYTELKIELIKDIKKKLHLQESVKNFV